MKSTTQLPTPVYRFALAALAFLAMLWTAPLAQAQPAITISQLLTQGFTNSPLPYSLRVTGIKGVGLIGARFNDIYLDGSGQVRAHGGFFSLYNLNYDMTLASVNTGGGGQLALRGVITLPKFLKNALEKRKVTLPQAEPALVVDGSGNIAFQGGTFTLPTPPYTFPFGPLTIENLALTINPTLQTFGGGADVGYGGGPTVAFCVAQGSTRIHGDFLLVDGDLDRLGVGASNLKKPLGTTGAYLDSLSATIGNLAANGGADWFIQGNASVVGMGCQINNEWPWRMNAQLAVNSAGFLDVKGSAFAFGIPTGEAYFRYNPPYTVALGGSVNFIQNDPNLQGIFIAEMGVQCTAGPTVAGYARGKLTIPRSVPVAGGWVFGVAEASFNNSGFRGSVTINVSPAIPSVCTPRYCLPGGCITWWSPKWNKPRRTCRDCWDGPCIPAICTPRIPAVSATVGFKYMSGRFTFGRPALDPMVEPWEKSFQEAIVEPETGDSLCFMCNWVRVDKCSTGPCGRPIAPVAAFGFAPAAAPPLLFELPSGEESVMFRLTWENPNNSLAFMSVRYSDYPPLSISSDEVFPEARFLRPLDNGTSFGKGAYLILDGSRREAIIGIPNPPAGQYSVHIDHTEGLGNYAVELLRQNVPPVVTVNSVNRTESPTEYAVNYTLNYHFGNTPTNPQPRFFLAQTACVPGTTRQVKSGGVYLVDAVPSGPSVNGANTRYIHTDSLNVPDGDYNVIVNIDDPASLEVEAISTQKLTVRNASAPAPVPSIATRGDNGGFTVSWQPSPSSNIQNYIVAYTKSALGNEFEFNVSTDGDARTATITNLNNGQPYLVTVFAMGTNGLQSCPAEKQRVIPTEGYGLNAPRIVSAPRVAATVGQSYVYMPEIFDADDAIRPSTPLPDGEDLSGANPPADGEGRQWSLVTAPAGMTIGSSNGVILWTPVAGQVGSNTVTVRVTDLSSLPPLQDAGSLVSPRFGEQTYNITVVGANNPPAFERNHYRFLTAPPVTAYVGEVYRYVPVVLFPTNKFTLTIDDGPPGLTVVQEGTAPNTTNVVVWTVSANSPGHRVVLRAVPDLGPSPSPDDTVLQEYYLDVSAPSKRLPQPTVITRGTPTPEGFGVRWVGGAANYQVQRATNLLESSNTVWQSITAPRPADAVNFHVDTNSVPPHFFYRILDFP